MAKTAPHPDPAIFDLDIPILGNLLRDATRLPGDRGCDVSPGDSARVWHEPNAM